MVGTPNCSNIYRYVYFSDEKQNTHLISILVPSLQFSPYTQTTTFSLRAYIFFFTHLVHINLLICNLF